jgi:hypothetical protein
MWGDTMNTEQKLREALSLLNDVVTRKNCEGADWGFLLGPLLNALAATKEALAAEPEDIQDMLLGMSVSVDVSTSDHDADRRYFGTVTEVMDSPEDKHGVTLLVQDAEPNFTSRAAEPDQGVPIGVVDVGEAAVEIYDDQLHRLRQGQAVYLDPPPPSLMRLTTTDIAKLYDRAEVEHRYLSLDHGAQAFAELIMDKMIKKNGGV